jgi:hypothetical protein
VASTINVRYSRLLSGFVCISMLFVILMYVWGLNLDINSESWTAFGTSSFEGFSQFFISLKLRNYKFDSCIEKSSSEYDFNG